MILHYNPKRQIKQKLIINTYYIVLTLYLCFKLFTWYKFYLQQKKILKIVDSTNIKILSTLLFFDSNDICKHFFLFLVFYFTPLFWLFFLQKESTVTVAVKDKKFEIPEQI
ncbi:hypothetical protein PSOLA_06640 [Candidatus Phytoplasma solani]